MFLPFQINFRPRNSLATPIAVALALAALGASPALPANVTFAQFTQAVGGQQWTLSGNPLNETITASGQTNFSFLFNGTPFTQGSNILSTFTLTANSAQIGNCGVSCGAGDSYTQPGYVGTFSFIDNAGGQFQGRNLLSGTFAITAGQGATTGAQFSSSIGSSGGTFQASATAGNQNQLVMTSDFLSLPGQTAEAASFSLSSFIPLFVTTLPANNQAYPNGAFAAAGAGTFSSNPGPTATPEPASFVLIGGGLLGFGLLRKKLARQ